MQPPLYLLKREPWVVAARRFTADPAACSLLRPSSGAVVLACVLPESLLRLRSAVARRPSASQWPRPSAERCWPAPLPPLALACAAAAASSLFLWPAPPPPNPLALACARAAPLPACRRRRSWSDRVGEERTEECVRVSLVKGCGVILDLCFGPSWAKILRWRDVGFGPGGRESPNWGTGRKRS